MFQILKRKMHSAVWRFNQWRSACHTSSIRFAVRCVGEKYWLLDYVPVRQSSQRSVVLIRLDLIGDFILWLDSAKSYRKLYPQHKITLVVNQVCLDLAEKLPYWDEVIPIDVGRLRKNDRYLLEHLFLVRRRGFIVAIQPTYSREWVGDLLVRATGSCQRIGYLGDLNNIELTKKLVTDGWYTNLVVNQDTSQNNMELNINAHFVRELGDRSFVSDAPFIAPLIKLPLHLQFKKNYIVIAPGASWKPRSWPTEHFVDLIKRLVNEFPYEIVLCGGHSDKDVCNELVTQIRSDKLLNLAGQTTLLELIEVIRHAKLLVSNESSPTHIAAATRTPSICLTGGGHFGRFVPYVFEKPSTGPIPVSAAHKMDCYGCKWRCKYEITEGASVPCLNNIKVTDVYKECELLLTTNA